MLRVFLFLLLTTWNLGLSAQEDQVFKKLARESLLTFTYAGGEFGGKGWQELLQHAQNHKYFLLGEDHGAAEIPALTRALSNHIQFDAFVVEVDSVSVSVISDLVQKSADEVQNYQMNYPSALSFYSAEEELELFKDTSLKNASHWGLDQVSLFSTGLVLRRLAELATSEQAAGLAWKLAAQSDALFDHASRTGNYDTLFIYSTQKETFEELQKAFAKESQEAKAVLNDLELSWKIQSGNGGSHTDRLAMMKRRFINYYIEARASGRPMEHVMLKFGANHMSRAESLLGHHDIGNLVANLAQAEFEKSYHLMVVGAKGKLNTFIPTEGMTASDFDIRDEGHDLSYLVPFLDEIPKNTWAYFDLKPLRQALRRGKIKSSHAWFYRTLMGFDGLVIAPEFTPSHLPGK